MFYKGIYVKVVIIFKFDYRIFFDEKNIYIEFGFYNFILYVIELK